jgi:hypothetical protein
MINQGTHLDLTSGYMGRAWTPQAIGRDAERLLKDVDYDTLVGTGLSGALVVPYLARRLGKRALIIRKPGEGSHSSIKAEGTLGHRWIFVDDFISTGDTFFRVLSTIKDIVRAYADEFETEHVGDLLYQQREYDHEGNGHTTTTFARSTES